MDVVCGTDFSADAKRAAGAGGALASRLDGKLVLVHGLELPTLAHVAGDVVLFPPTRIDQQALRDKADEVLAAEAGRVAKATGARVEAVLDIGASDQVVLDAARRAKAGMIVVGSHGHRAPVRWILGSTAERLTASSPIPVLVTRGDPSGLVGWAKRERRLRLLMGVDFEDSFQPAARQVGKLAGAGDVDVEVAHVCELPLGEVGRYPYAPAVPIRRVDLEANVRTELRHHAEAAGLLRSEDALHVLWGKPAPALARFAEEGRFDLVVVGTHGRHGLERALLGSVAHGLLRRSALPVLVTPFPPG